MHGRTLTVRVARIVPMTADVSAFELEHPWGRLLPGYAAGAHLDVHTPGGFTRQYSLARAPERDGPVARYVIGVKREAGGRGGSVALHDRVQEGDLIAVSAPRCTFALQPGPRHRLLAGGIGLTPLLAMAEQLQRDGRPYTLAVFARHRDHLAFAEALAALGTNVQYHFDDPSDPHKLDLAALLVSPQPGEQLCVCGPAGFMQAVQRAAAAWPEAQVHREFFAVPDGGADAARGEPFTLRLARRGLDVAVGAEQSAVEALAELGIDVPTSCEQGLCGTCVVRWHGTAPEHRDFCLTGAERAQQVALCCSRAAGGVLEVDL